MEPSFPKVNEIHPNVDFVEKKNPALFLSKNPCLNSLL